MAGVRSSKVLNVRMIVWSLPYKPLERLEVSEQERHIN